MASGFGLREGDVLQQRYRLLRLLGKGGMGSVYLAEDLRLPGKRWAVKETIPLFGDTASFLQEAELLARLQHPLLPQIVDYYAPSEAGGSAYVVMELVPGVTLEDVTQQRHGRFSEDSVVSIGRQLCDALVYLHQQQPEPIVFRDLKPGNIMIDEQGRIKLIDFGIARRFKPQQTADTVPLGTIGFAAPEQLRGEQTDPRSDLYSLGAVLYYLLTGGQYAAVAQRPLTELRPDLSAPLENIVTRLLQLKPEDRLQRAEEVLTLLRELGRKHRDLHAKPDAASPAKPKLILVGSLYPGAGATFAAFALSLALDRAGVDHAVCEHPVTAPDHYALLDGERNAPRGYRCLSERVLLGEGFAGMEWTSGHAMRVPSHPTANGEGWTGERVAEWLTHIRRSVVIVDVAHEWTHPTVSPLIAAADERIVVVDPSPAKLHRPSTRALLRELDSKARSGQSMTWVANRDAVSPHRSEWLHMLPGVVSVTLPAFDTAVMLEAHWNGSAVPLENEHRMAIIQSFAQFVAKKGLLKSNSLV